MKTIRKTVVLLVLILGMISTATQKATAQVSVNFQLFYDNLSPYGNWVDNSSYGYVWVPNVSRGFAPYSTNGYWVYTEMGWTWVSNYSWGWAPFHYGRWYYDSFYGWVWVPDTQWGPAWVTWRYYDGYYGWAAIGPGISMDMAYSNGYNVPHHHWVFVRERDFGRRNISNYYVNNSNNTTIINNSKVINNIRTDNTTRVQYNAGPNRDDVQKRSKTVIAQVNLKERGKPGQSINKNELQLYKPRVERGDDNRKPVPAKVMRQNEVKPVEERKGIVQPKREIKRQIEKPMVQPSRQPGNLERSIQPQEKQQIQMQRSEQRVKEQEMQRREREAVRQQRDLNRQQRDLNKRMEQPMQQPRNIIPTPQQELLPQRGNNPERLPILQKRERNK